MKSHLSQKKKFHVTSSKPETDPFYVYQGRKKLGERLLSARQHQHYTRDMVLQKSETGFSKSSLQAWENGDREPNLEVLFDLANIYQVNLNDLLGLSRIYQESIHPENLQGETNTNTVLRESSGVYNIDSTDTDNDVEYVVTSDTSSRGHRDPSSVYNIDSNDRDSGAEYVLIPTYDIEVSAGPGLFTQGVTGSSRYLAFRKRWMRMRGLHIENLAVLLTKGDSMVPTIPESAAVVIDRARNTALDGKVYVIRIDDRLFVKRTQWLPSGGLRLISDNKEVYQPTDISPEDFAASNVEVCGQVIHASYDLPD